MKGEGIHTVAKCHCFYFAHVSSSTVHQEHPVGVQKKTAGHNWKKAFSSFAFSIAPDFVFLCLLPPSLLAPKGSLLSDPEPTYRCDH